MKIVVVSTTDIYGGAGIAAFRTFKALQAEGVDAKMFVQYKFSDDPNVIQSSKKYLGYLRTGFDKILGYYAPEIWSSSYLRSFNVKQLLDLKPDVINLNWVNNTLSIRDLERLAKSGVKITWTLHDMWAFSGGFHYTPANKVGFFRKKLDNCLFNYKKKIFNRLSKKIHIITCSNWLGDEARKSEILKDFNVSVIHNGSEPHIFKPIINAKKTLGLNSNKKYVLFGAMASLNDKRKGSDLLIEALNKIPINQVELLIFGAQKQELHLKHKTHFFGTIKDKNKLATIYSAADVFVAPSRMENLANTVIEAMCCETPVVAFNIGGMPDMIDSSNGALAKPFNVKDLANKIKSVINKPELGINGRKKVFKKFTLKQNAQAHIKLCRELLRR